jgi:hypothetical protein
VAALLVPGGHAAPRPAETKTKVLVVDEGPPDAAKAPGSDLFILNAFFTAAENFTVKRCKPADLGKGELTGQAVALLLDVAELPEDAVKKLESFVKDGGGLVLFLGEKVKAAHYNDRLFKAGLFPVRIEEQPFDPLAAGFPDPEDRQKERRRRLEKVDRPNLLFPHDRHPVVAGVARYGRFFGFLSVAVYWKAQPRAKWDADGKQTQTLAALRYTGPVTPFKKSAEELLEETEKTLARVVAKKAALKPHAELARRHRRDALAALAADDPFKLAASLHALLSDSTLDKGDRIDLAALWMEADLRAPGARLAALRDQCLHGDPLVVARRTGKGRVVAVLTPPGSAARPGVGREKTVIWSNWSTGRGVASTYPVFLLDLFRFAHGAAPKD